MRLDVMMVVRYSAHFVHNAQLCRNLESGRIISCKSAKDRTAMSVTLEQAHILTREMNMDSASFQHAIDAMRR